MPDRAGYSLPFQARHVLGSFAFVALGTNPLLLSMLGMEGLLNVLLFAAALVCFLKGRWNVMGVAFRLLTLARSRIFDGYSKRQQSWAGVGGILRTGGAHARGQVIFALRRARHGCMPPAMITSKSFPNAIPARYAIMKICCFRMIIWLLIFFVVSNLASRFPCPCKFGQNVV